MAERVRVREIDDDEGASRMRGIMHIIELTGFGVRSAVITMRRKDTPLKFVLFPMLHVASPAFYAQVRTRLKACDVIVAEGIRGKSRQMSTLTLAYRFAPRQRRNGLEEQNYAALPVLHRSGTSMYERGAGAGRIRALRSRI